MLEVNGADSRASAGISVRDGALSLSSDVGMRTQPAARSTASSEKSAQIRPIHVRFIARPFLSVSFIRQSAKHTKRAAGPFGFRYVLSL